MRSVSLLTLGVSVICLISAVAPFAHSQQEFLNPLDSLNGSQSGSRAYLNLMVGVRKYLNSFTSWQLPASDGPQDPVSRLEYPWDQTFLAVRCTTACTVLELNIEWSGTLGLLSNPEAQDSDWLDRQNPGQKTTFSEAEAKPRCWIVDLSCNAAIPGFPFVRGVAGYRVGQFKFTNTDGYQYGIYDDQTDMYEWYAMPLPGPCIEFSQYYKHLYAGGIFDASIDFRRFSNGLMDFPLLVRLQADASYVTAKAHDEHLLRPNVFALIRSTGYGWHLNLTTGLQTNRFRLCIEGDVRGIRTSGPLENFDEIIAGAKVWSEQKYLGMNGTIFF